MSRALAFGLLAVAILLGTGRVADAQAPVKIGVLFPTKSLVGKQGAQGAALAADMLNAEGGVLGRKIELITYDTNFSPVEGVAAAQRLLAQDGVKILIGEISSTVGLAVIPVARSQGALFIAAVPKHPDITKSGYDRVFRLNSTTAMDSADFNSVLTQTLNPTKVAVLAENSDFGRLVIEDLKKLFGSKVVFADTYEMTQSDFNSLVTNAKGSGADLLCIAGSNMEQYGNIMRTRSDLRFNARQCVMPGILNSQGVKIAGKAAEGAVSADLYVPSIDNPLNKKFVADYQAKFKETPEKIELLGFESVWIVAQAMRKANTTDDNAKLAETIRTNVWETPRGNVKFDASGQAASGPLYKLIVKDGALTQWTP